MPCRQNEWDFIDGLRLDGHLCVDNAEAQLECALQGLGLAHVPRYLAAPHLESGSLQQVLPGLCPPPLPISIVYLSGRSLPTRVRVFIDWTAELFRSSALVGDGH
jgi:LysR family transcriptional regulator for bpeEF and oprC